jgi:hypothetical protein
MSETSVKIKLKNIKLFLKTNFIYHSFQKMYTFMEEYCKVHANSELCVQFTYIHHFVCIMYTDTAHTSLLTSSCFHYMVFNLPISIILYLLCTLTQPILVYSLVLVFIIWCSIYLYPSFCLYYIQV